MDAYKFKDDTTYHDAMKILEFAQKVVDDTSDWLRAANGTNPRTVDEWQPRYRQALGYINQASDMAKIAPKGACVVGRALQGVCSPF